MCETWSTMYFSIHTTSQIIVRWHSLLKSNLVGGDVKKITREFVMQKCWKEYCSPKNSSIIRLRYMLLFCALRGYIKYSMPNDPGTGAANTPDLEAFDKELMTMLRGGNNAVQRPGEASKVQTQLLSSGSEGGTANARGQESDQSIF